MRDFVFHRTLWIQWFFLSSFYKEVTNILPFDERAKEGAEVILSAALIWKKLIFRNRRMQDSDYTLIPNGGQFKETNFDGAIIEDINHYRETEQIWRV